MSFVLICSLILLGWTNGNQEANPTIQIQQGSLIGTRMLSTKGRTFYAFRGIPYAKPPLGALRFKPPLPGEPWQGTFNATEDGVKCPQLNLWTEQLSYDEDCLTLNVYTPNIPETSRRGEPQGSKPLLPVMVYIHEGLFAAGEASSTNKPPQRLMNKDIVLVVIQYRLGPLGFLSTGDSAAPGNFGMLDQVLALKWTKDNIHAFGGDPNRVTLCGQSAGGASVVYHTISPLSKDLFRGAIAQSGSVFSPWAFQKDPRPWAIRLGSEVQCPTNDSTSLVDCLRFKSVQDIINGTVQIDGYVLEVGPFVPVVESAFLPRSPAELVKDVDFRPVPLMTGATKDEAAGIFYDPVSPFNVIDDEFFRDILPEWIGLLTKYTGNLSNLTRAVKETYYDPIDVNNRTQVVQAGTDFLTDVAYKAPLDATVRGFAARNATVYMYSFEYAGNVSEANFTGERQITHEDDLYYIFNRTDLKGRDLQMSDTIVEMWTNFVTHLAPTTKDSQIVWTRTLPDEQLSYLEIGENAIIMKTGYRTQQMKFWNEEAPRLVSNAPTQA